MKVVLTGGAGYIGTHTLLELLAREHDICVVDNFSNSCPEALNRTRQLSNRDFLTEEADIRDRDRLTAIFAGFQPDAVIHFAGLKAVGEGEAKPVEYYDTNVTGTLTLLDAMKASDCERIIFSSSATVYGDPQYLPLDEAHPCAPASVYGRTKLMAEQILTDWTRARPGSGTVILRYFNPVGAHESGRIGEDPQGIPNNLMPFIAQVAVGRRGKLAIFGGDYNTPDGTGIRDYIHVVDLARAHVAALDYAALHEGAEVFNIGTGTGTSVRDMLTAYSKACGRELPSETVTRRPGDIAACYADVSFAREALKWDADYTVDDMCASSWKWQSQNPHGYTKI